MNRIESAAEVITAAVPLVPRSRPVGVPVERLMLIASAALAVALPIIVWWDLPVPGRRTASVLTALLCPGVPIAIRLFPRNRAVWCGLGPAISLAWLMAVSVGQVVLDWWSPPLTASLAAVVTLPAVALSWNRVTGRFPWPVTIPRPGLWGPWLALVAALGLWWWALQAIDLDAVGGLGLLGVLPWQYVLALASVMSVAGWALCREAMPPALLGVSAVLATLMITTFVSLADGGAVAGTGYVHVGFAAAIGDTGALITGLDARFSWPGFFTGAATVTSWAGISDASSLLLLYPAVIGSLQLAPVFVLGRAVSRSDRIAWLGVLLFVCGNWVQQDYFSPQSVALLTYLVILSTLLHRTAAAIVPSPNGPLRHRLRGVLTRTPSRAPGESARQAIAVEVVLVCLMAGMVVSHQLTPAALVGVLMLLGLTGTIRSRTLWVPATVLFLGWFAFGAMDWWTGHLAVLIDGFGQVGQSLESGISRRVSGDPTYQRMQTLRIGLSAIFAVGGLVGWFLSRRVFPLSATASLVAAPLALVVAQPYGGEVVLRAFLYTLPVLAVLSAVALAFLLRQRRAWAGPALMALLIAGSMLLTAARGANVAFERNPADSLEAARQVLTAATSGDTIWPLATDGTLRSDRVGEVYTAVITGADGTAFERLLAAAPDYVVLSDSRQAYEHLVNGNPVDWFSEIEADLLGTGQYRVMVDAPHTTVLERVPAEQETP